MPRASRRSNARPPPPRRRRRPSARSRSAGGRRSTSSRRTRDGSPTPCAPGRRPLGGLSGSRPAFPERTFTSASRASASVRAMAYELTLEPDRDRGGSRYRIAVSGDVAPGVVRDLSDWLANAMQNPAASFEIDLTEAGRTSPRARFELAALMRRHRSLVDGRRLFVRTPRRGRPRVVAGGPPRPRGGGAGAPAAAAP